MIAETQIMRGSAAFLSACAEIMGGPEKPGHDDQKRGG
jgi:hypothetical protein